MSLEAVAKSGVDKHGGLKEILGVLSMIRRQSNPSTSLLEASFFDYSTLLF